MNSTRSTRWLAALLVVAALCCAAAYARLSRLSDDAARAERAFADARAQLRQLSGRQLPGRGGGGDGGSTDPNAQVNRHVRDAAAAAGVAEKLVSIEPGEPNQVAGTDYREMLVFLRLEPLSLRELVTFLHAHASADGAAHAKEIELSASAAEDPRRDGLWQADVTLAYTSYAPQPEAMSR